MNMLATSQYLHMFLSIANVAPGGSANNTVRDTTVNHLTTQDDKGHLYTM